MAIVHLGKLSKAICSRFGSDVSLGLGHHLVPHHELADCRRSQQRGIEMHMQCHSWVVPSVEGTSVPPHGIRKRMAEQVVVLHERVLQNSSQSVSLCCVQVGQMPGLTEGYQQRLERPHGPIGDDRRPLVVVGDDSRTIGELVSGVVEEQV